jgi:hypothetical protein
MLPRPISYLLNDYSLIWKTYGLTLFLFIADAARTSDDDGSCTVMPCGLGLVCGTTRRNGAAYWMLSSGLCLLVLVTLSVGGSSLWWYFHALPLASAIRAMSRIDLILLLPVAYLAALAVDFIWIRRSWGPKLIIFIMTPLLFIEISSATFYTSSKHVWRERLAVLEAFVPGEMTADQILFVAQRSNLSYADELDAMWIALKRGVPTMNGYSGNQPPGFSSVSGNDCAEVPRRVLAYLEFQGPRQRRGTLYRALMGRIVPVGFVGCVPDWKTTAPAFTRIDRSYTPRRLPLALTMAGRQMIGGLAASLSQSITRATSLLRPNLMLAHLCASLGGSLTGLERRVPAGKLDGISPRHTGQRKSASLISRRSEHGCFWQFVQVSLVQEGCSGRMTREWKF